MPRFLDSLTMLAACALAACDPANAALQVEKHGGAAVEEAVGKGPADAKVTIQVFTDYQCPFCRKLDQTLERVMAAHPNEVRVQIVNSPLPMHEQAPLAAIAARAAQKQGKFWEMHRRLMRAQGLERDSLEKYASEVGLDVGAFRAELDSGDARAALAKETELAAKLGVKGTPTMFVNGRRVVGAQPFEAIDRVVREELGLAAITADPIEDEGMPGGCDKPAGDDCECDKRVVE